MMKFRLIFLSLTLLFFASTANAQRPYFVYLQTESQEPFFVQINKKNLSSSSVGHLILSGLVNGTYDISLGFPGQNATQQYSLVVESTDRGYLVKKFENGEWGLVDLQTSATQLSGAAKREAEKAEIELAIAAANAKKLEEEQALKAEKAKADSISALEKNKAADSVALAAAAAAAVGVQDAGKKDGNDEVKQDSAKNSEGQNDAGKVIGTAAVVTTAVAATQNIDKKEGTGEIKAEEKTAEKTAETASVQTSGTAAPPSGSGVNAGAGTAAVAAGTLSAAEIMKLQEEARRIDAQGKRDSVLKAQKNDSTATKTATAAPVFLDMEMTMPADSLKTKTDTALAVVPAAVPVTKSDSVQNKEVVPAKNPNCTAEATDADIEMVTMLIKGEKAPEDGLEMARKTMKIKCVQTAQVRKLALLFEGQEDRYRLLDMAYRYTVDRHNYSSLGDLLTDTYYLNRFKAMLQ